MKAITENLNYIKDNNTPTSHDSFYCAVNMINHLQKLELHIKSYKDKVQELLKIIDTKEELEDMMTGTIETIQEKNTELKNHNAVVEHLKAKLKDRDKTLEKMTEMLADKDKKLNHYMGRK